MSDLSWLNPTPHAIAVYASRPLSPVAAQHSLPSGRYSLLGPDFHRLDRTSLRLAHSFDHLVGAQQDRCRQVDSDCFGSLEVDGHLEFRRLIDRQIPGLCTFKNFGHVISGPAIHQYEIDAVRHQPAGADVMLLNEHCRQVVLDSQLANLGRMRNEEGTRKDEHNLRGPCFRVSKCNFEIVWWVFEP